MSFVWETPEEINLALAKRLSRIRKRRNLSQVQLSEKSNVSYGSIKRFETSGQISLLSLTRLCVALGCVEEIKNLFKHLAASGEHDVALHYRQHSPDTIIQSPRDLRSSRCHLRTLLGVVFEDEFLVKRLGTRFVVCAARRISKACCSLT